MFTQVPFALTPGPPITTKPLQDAIADTAAAGRRRAAEPARRRAHRHPAAPPAPHPQRRPAAPHRRRRRRHHRRAAGPGLVVPGRARPAGHRQDVHLGAGDRDPGQRARLAHRGGGAVARGGREPVRRRDRRPGWTAPRVGKKLNTVSTGWTELDRDDYARFHRRQDGCVVGGTAWDFANANKIARDSLDLLVIEEAGQFSLANTIAVARVGPQPAAARRPAAAATGQPGHPPRAGRRVRAGLARRRPPHAAARTRVLPGPLLPHASRRVPGRCPGCPTTAGCARRERHRGAPPRRRRARGADAGRRPPRQRDREPRGGRRDRRRDRPACSARRGPTSTAPGRWRRSDVLVVTPYNAQVVPASAAGSTRPG